MSEAELARLPEVAVIGGGTGSFTILSELKFFANHLSAIVNMSDSGGSTGRLRDEFGVLPPGDLRMCITALSDDPEARKLLDVRYPEDSELHGHNFGNIMLSTLEMIYEGDITRALAKLHKFAEVPDNRAAIPVTLDRHHIIVDDGERVFRREARIARATFNGKKARLSYDSPTTLNENAQKAIENAGLIVIAPGSLFASLLPALSVEGMAETIAGAKGKKVFVANLVNKPNHTPGWHVRDYVKVIERTIGEGTIDLVLFNSQQPSQKLINKYAAKDEHPVRINKGKLTELGERALGEALVDDRIYRQDPNDKETPRTLIRHNARRVGEILVDLFGATQNSLSSNVTQI